MLIDTSLALPNCSLAHSLDLSGVHCVIRRRLATLLWPHHPLHRHFVEQPTQRSVHIRAAGWLANQQRVARRAPSLSVHPTDYCRGSAVVVELFTIMLHWSLYNNELLTTLSAPPADCGASCGDVIADCRVVARRRERHDARDQAGDDCPCGERSRERPTTTTDRNLPVGSVGLSDGRPGLASAGAAPTAFSLTLFLPPEGEFSFHHCAS